MIKRIVTFITCIALVFIVSCKKVTNNACPYSTSAVTAPSDQSDSLRKLLKDSGIVAIKDTAGFFYIINQQGTGAYTSGLCQSISVSYKATFFGGEKLDSTAAGQTADFQLGRVIVGWQKGIPLIAAGGDITLFLPPALAYGSIDVADNMGHVIIPANSYLTFHIKLVDVQ